MRWSRLIKLCTHNPLILLKWQWCKLRCWNRPCVFSSQPLSTWRLAFGLRKSEGLRRSLCMMHDCCWRNPSNNRVESSHFQLCESCLIRRESCRGYYSTLIYARFVCRKGHVQEDTVDQTTHLEPVLSTVFVQYQFCSISGWLPSLVSPNRHLLKRWSATLEEENKIFVQNCGQISLVIGHVDKSLVPTVPFWELVWTMNMHEYAVLRAVLRANL